MIGDFTNSNIPEDIFDALQGSEISPLGLATIAMGFIGDDDKFMEYLENRVQEIKDAEFTLGQHFKMNGKDYKVLEIERGELIAADENGDTESLELVDMQIDLKQGVITIVSDLMELDWEQKLTTLAEKLHAAGFTDNNDATPGICLHDKGIMRNPETGVVIYCVPLNNQSAGDDPVMAWTNVTVEEVIEDLEDIEYGFYDCIGSTVTKQIELVEKDPNYLTGIIEAMNAYNGKYQQFGPECWNETPDSLRRFLS